MECVDEHGFASYFDFLLYPFIMLISPYICAPISLFLIMWILGIFLPQNLGLWYRLQIWQLIYIFLVDDDPISSMFFDLLENHTWAYWVLSDRFLSDPTSRLDLNPIKLPFVVYTIIAKCFFHIRTVRVANVVVTLNEWLNLLLSKYKNVF